MTIAPPSEMFGKVLNRTNLLINEVEVSHLVIQHQAKTKTMETVITVLHLNVAEGLSRSEEAQLDRRLWVAKRRQMVPSKIDNQTARCHLLPSSSSLMMIIGAV